MILVSVVTFKGNYVKPRLGAASEGVGSGPRRSHSISAATPIIAALSVQSSGAGMTRCAALPRRARGLTQPAIARHAAAQHDGRCGVGGLGRLDALQKRVNDR